MQDIVQFAGNMDKFGNIMIVELKIGKFKEMFNVFDIPCDEVVHGDDMKAFLNKSVAEVRSQESSCSSY